MRERPNHTSQGLIFVGVCVLLAAILFFAVKLGRVPAQPAGTGNDVALIIENTYQPDMSAIDGDALYQANDGSYDAADAGSASEAAPIEDADPGDMAAVPGREDEQPAEAPQGAARACSGRWTDRQPNGVQVSFGSTAANVPVFEWRYGTHLFFNRRYDPTNSPVRLQVSAEEVYDMTCDGDRGAIVPVGQSGQSGWPMYRTK